MAERGQELATLYGQLEGLLLDLTVPDGKIDQRQAHLVIALFPQAKEREDKLERLPAPDQQNSPSTREFTDSLQRGRAIVEAARALDMPNEQPR